jgi:hypothetical protein
MLTDDRDFGPAMARLTQRQPIFVDVCGLQTAAARRAGYSNRGHADAVVGHGSPTTRKSRPRSVRNGQHAVASGLDDCTRGARRSSGRGAHGAALKGYRRIQVMLGMVGHVHPTDPVKAARPALEREIRFRSAAGVRIGSAVTERHNRHWRGRAWPLGSPAGVRWREGRGRLADRGAIGTFGSRGPATPPHKFPADFGATHPLRYFRQAYALGTLAKPIVEAGHDPAPGASLRRCGTRL